jgi:hypothetical protein
VRYASLTISCTFWVKIINTPFLDSCLINDAFLYRSFSSNGILYFRYCSKVVDHFATLHNMLQKLTSSNIAYLPVWNTKVRTMIVKIVKDLWQCLHKTLDIWTVELEHHYVWMFGSVLAQLLEVALLEVNDLLHHYVLYTHWMFELISDSIYCGLIRMMILSKRKNLNWKDKELMHLGMRII